MSGFKKKCPICNCSVESYNINFDCEVEMCENEKCIYPFAQSSAEGLIIENPIALKGYSNKKHKALSTAANTTGSYAVPVACSAQSAQNPRQGLNSTKPSDLNSQQKDKSHLIPTPPEEIASLQANVKSNRVSQEKIKTPAKVTISSKRGHRMQTRRSTRNTSVSAPSLATPPPKLVLPSELALPLASAAKTHQPVTASTTQTSPVIGSATSPNTEPMSTSASIQVSPASNQPTGRPFDASESTKQPISVHQTNENADLSDMTSILNAPLMSASTTPFTNNFNFNITSLESFLLHDVESPTDSFIATPEAPIQQDSWLHEFGDIFKSTDVVESSFDPLSF